MKTIISLYFFFFSFLSLFAQQKQIKISIFDQLFPKQNYQDLVVLKNGNKINGLIINNRLAKDSTKIFIKKNKIITIDNKNINYIKISDKLKLLNFSNQIITKDNKKYKGIIIYQIPNKKIEFVDFDKKYYKFKPENIKNIYFSDKFLLLNNDLDFEIVKLKRSFFLNLATALNNDLSISDKKHTFSYSFGIGYRINYFLELELKYINSSYGYEPYPGYQAYKKMFCVSNSGCSYNPTIALMADGNNFCQVFRSYIKFKTYAITSNLVFLKRWKFQALISSSIGYFSGEINVYGIKYSLSNDTTNALYVDKNNSIYSVSYKNCNPHNILEAVLCQYQTPTVYYLSKTPLYGPLTPSDKQNFTIDYSQIFGLYWDFGFGLRYNYSKRLSFDFKIKAKKGFQLNNHPVYFYNHKAYLQNTLSVSVNYYLF